MRRYELDAFAKMYGPVEGKDAIAQVMSQTGADALKGADTRGWHSRSTPPAWNTPTIP